MRPLTAVTCFEPTYKELKQPFLHTSKNNAPSFEPTYKELKQEIRKEVMLYCYLFRAYLQGIETILFMQVLLQLQKVSSLPTRN